MRDELAHAYAAARGATARRDTLDGLEAVVRWLRRCERHEGLTFHRSMPQAFRGIGWLTSGRVRDDRQRHRNRLANWLDMLAELGVVESWRPIYSDTREGLGILVTLRRDSSVGGAHQPPRPPRRPTCTGAADEPPRRRVSSYSRVSPPLREKCPCTPSTGCRGSGKTQRARAARAREGRAGHRATAWAIEALKAAGEGSGHELIDRLPGLAALQPGVLLRAATFAYAPQPSAGWAKQWKPLLSEQSRRQAEAAVAQLDRYDGRGAGAAAILDLAAGGWRAHLPAGRPPRFVEPRTPGLLVKGLRQRARMARRAARLRDELYAAADGGS